MQPFPAEPAETLTNPAYRANNDPPGCSIARARMHWCGYLEQMMPAPAPTPAPGRAQQLGLLETLVNLVRPGRRISENRPRLLSTPIPRTRR